MMRKDTINAMVRVVRVYRIVVEGVVRIAPRDIIEAMRKYTIVEIS